MNNSTKWDESEWSCTILCMGGGGTFGVQIVPQNIENYWKVRNQRFKAKYGKFNVRRLTTQKVLSVSLYKHKDFKARYDKIHVSAY